MPMPDITIIVSAFKSKSLEYKRSMATIISVAVSIQIPNIDTMAPITSNQYTAERIWLCVNKNVSNLTTLIRLDKL